MTGMLLLLALVPGQDQDQPRKQDRAGPQVKERRIDRVVEWNALALEAIRRDKTPAEIDTLAYARSLSLAAGAEEKEIPRLEVPARGGSRKRR